VNALHGGVGFYYLYDNVEESTMQTNRINVSYAAHFEIKEKLVLRIGFTGGYVNRKVDWDRLSFGDLIDPRYGFIYPVAETRPPSTKSFFDCGIGTAVYMKNFYIGFAIDHLNQPEESFISSVPAGNLESKLVLNAGSNIPIGDSEKQYSVNPDIIYIRQGDYDYAIPSITFRLKYFLIGSGFNSDKGFIMMAGFENKFLRIGYSRDWTYSELGDTTFESWELTASVKLYKVAPKKRKWIPINIEAL
jgi:type IX secretion system PorP/SprF family membrane protein